MGCRSSNGCLCRQPVSSASSALIRLKACHDWLTKVTGNTSAMPYLLSSYLIASYPISSLLISSHLTSSHIRLSVWSTVCACLQLDGELVPDEEEEDNTVSSSVSTPTVSEDELVTSHIWDLDSRFNHNTLVIKKLPVTSQFVLGTSELCGGRFVAARVRRSP